MQRFYIIADDLTGANDAGVQLAKIGISSTVFLNLKESSLTVAEDVAIIDTDSRAVSEKAAYERVYQASSIFYNQGFKHVYKKIDSTIRGNVAVELAAVAAVHQPEIVVVAPAYPKMRRTTVAGVQHVNGQPVSETEFGQDPKTPVKDSFIPNLLKKYADRICLIDKSLYESSMEDLMEYIKEKSKEGTTWFVCDATTDRDLELISEAFAKINKSTVWAGSAGLIELLPKVLQLSQKKITNEKPAVSKTLTVSASLSNVTKLQIDDVKQMEDSYIVEADPIALIKKTYRVDEIVSEFIQQSNKKHFVLFVDSTADNRNATKQLESELGLSKTQIGESISNELAVISEAIIAAITDINGLVLTGGDTAKAICNRLNMNEMQLYTEVEAGLPIGLLGGSTDFRSFWTVTKAGGFGNEHSLRNALEYMTGRMANMTQVKPVIGITMGDGAGVGPETILKSLGNKEIYDICNPFVIGDSKILERAKGFTNSDLKIETIKDEQIGELSFEFGTVYCLDLNLLSADLPIGQVSAEAGHAAFEYLSKAIDLAKAHKIDAICTAPLNKEALHKGGHQYPGHTEILADLTNTKDFSMMLSAPNLKVIHVTTHVGIIDAVKMINPERVYHVIKLAHDTLTRSGIKNPKIAVCGINPHAGENGLFGYGEEEEKVIPGVEKAQKEGINAFGPLPADTLFFRAVRGDFDVVVAMYHDQGHGPVKVLGLDAGVNITVGLPIIRTSVDHGTAFDIAGTGIVEEKSMMEAIRQAVELAPNRV